MPSNASYTVLLDLSKPHSLNQWQTAAGEMGVCLAHWLDASRRLNTRRVRVLGHELPALAREVFAAQPLVELLDVQPAATNFWRTAAEGLDGDIVLLTDGNIWIEDSVDGLVEEHRASGNRLTICNFHAGFSPIIASAAELRAVSPAAVRLTRHLQELLESPRSGVGQIRRPIPDHNVYLRLDQPEGWGCFAWIVRSGKPRGQWKVPEAFRAGQVEVRENYHRAFRTMGCFRSLEGARVLEIGCSPRNTTAPRMLIEEFGVRQYAGINLERMYFDWSHPAASFHVGDAMTAPFEPASFDLIFSLAVWEHVENPRALFHKVPDWLAPGGGHYGLFQVWSSAEGFHLPPSAFPGKRPPLFGHLTMTPEQFAARLRENTTDDAAVAGAVGKVFDDPYINRVRAAEFLDIILSCGLEVVYLDGRCGGRLQRPAIVAAEAAGRGFTPEELSIRGFEFYLRKSDFRLTDVRAPSLGE